MITRTPPSRGPAHRRDESRLSSQSTVCEIPPHLILTGDQYQGIIIRKCKFSQGWDYKGSRRYILWWRRVTLAVLPFTSSRKRGRYNFSEKKSGQISNLHRGHFWSPHTHSSPTLSDRTSLVAQVVKNLPAMQETRVWSPGLGRSPGEGNGNPLQYSCLESSTDIGAWRAAVHKGKDSDSVCGWEREWAEYWWLVGLSLKTRLFTRKAKHL